MSTRRTLAILLSGGFLFVGVPGATTAAERGEPRADGDTDGKRRPAKQRRARRPERQRPNDTPPKDAVETRSDDRPEDRSQPSRPGEPPIKADVASAPEELMRPGGVGDMQRALADRGFLGEHTRGSIDAATREALRKMQRSEKLPETGLPDHETIRKLGLDPDDIFRKNVSATADGANATPPKDRPATKGSSDGQAEGQRSEGRRQGEGQARGREKGEK